jgi:transcriptional regulator with XRE-family HTH domain
MAQTRSDDHVAFGQALRALRKRSGLTQQQLADAAGLDRAYLGAIERGEANPSLSNLLSLAKTLRVPLRDLAGAAELISSGLEQLLGESRTEARHPLALLLEKAAIVLKDANRETTPITAQGAEDILHDATRVVLELIGILQHFEDRTGRRTGVTSDLFNVADRLEHLWESRPNEAVE